MVFHSKKHVAWPVLKPVSIVKYARRYTRDRRCVHNASTSHTCAVAVCTRTIICVSYNGIRFACIGAGVDNSGGVAIPRVQPRTAHLALYTSHCTPRTERLTLYTSQCTPRTGRLALYTSHCTLRTAYTAQCPNPQPPKNRAALHTSHCTPRTVYLALYPAH